MQVAKKKVWNFHNAAKEIMWIFSSEDDISKDISIMYMNMMVKISWVGIIFNQKYINKKNQMYVDMVIDGGCCIA